MYSTDLLRAEVISLFEDNPSKKLPFVAFQYFFEKNFHRSLTRADMRRLKDTIELITDYPIKGKGQPGRGGWNDLTDSNNNCGKYIVLSGKYKAALTLPSMIRQRDSILPFCSLHCSDTVLKHINGNTISPESINYANHGSVGDAWLDEEPFLCLPLVNISLKKLAPKLHALLDSHSGCLPLNSLISCYYAQFSETFNNNQGPLVPLEHLISCLPGIEVTLEPEVGFKKIIWSPSNQATGSSSSTTSNCPASSSSSLSDGSSSTSCTSVGHVVSNPNNNYSNYNNVNNNNNNVNVNNNSPGSELAAKQMSQFSREVRDLLKNQPRCLIAFSKFVPAYHNHFGRQCCVYQYGYTKLIELLEAIPHAVQILGEGSRRMLTLTHREQTKRFASDLIRILKASPGKRLTLAELPGKYEKILEKPFAVENYGVCELTDILTDVWEGTVMITYSDDGDSGKIVVEIPKKERSPEEIERTKYLVRDILELLQSTPTLSMPFSKFIPTYHHYYNRQCKVSDYGFTKLIELFESLSPEVVELEDNVAGDEKIIKLSHQYKVKTIVGRLTSLVKSQPGHLISLDNLAQLFKHEYGHAINFRAYGVKSMVQLIEILSDSLRLVSNKDSTLVTLVDRKGNRTFVHRIIRILMERLSGSMSLSELCHAYRKRFGQHLIEQTVLSSDLNCYIDFDVKSNIVSLNSYHLFARDCILAIQSSHSGQVSLSELSEILKMNQSYPDSMTFGYKSFRALIQSLSDYIFVTKKSDGIRVTTLLTLARPFAERKLILSNSEPRYGTNRRSSFSSSSTSIGDLRIDQRGNRSQKLRLEPLASTSNQQLNEIVDILSQSLPPNLPKPNILPTQKAPDLILFDTPFKKESELLPSLNWKVTKPDSKCPPPPNDWLKSFSDKQNNNDTKEEVKPNKNEPRKVKPRRIAANFTSLSLY